MIHLARGCPCHRGLRKSGRLALTARQGIIGLYELVHKKNLGQAPWDPAVRPISLDFRQLCLSRSLAVAIHSFAQDRVYPAEVSTAFRFEPGENIVVDPE